MEGNETSGRQQFDSINKNTIYVGAKATRKTDGSISGMKSSQWPGIPTRYSNPSILQPISNGIQDTSNNNLKQPYSKLPLRMVLSKVARREDAEVSLPNVVNECKYSVDDIFLRPVGRDKLKGLEKMGSGAHHFNNLNYKSTYQQTSNMKDRYTAFCGNNSSTTFTQDISSKKDKPISTTETNFSENEFVNDHVSLSTSYKTLNEPFKTDIPIHKCQRKVKGTAVDPQISTPYARLRFQELYGKSRIYTANQFSNNSISSNNLRDSTDLKIIGSTSQRLNIYKGLNILDRSINNTTKSSKLLKESTGKTISETNKISRIKSSAGITYTNGLSHQNAFADRSVEDMMLLSRQGIYQNYLPKEMCKYSVNFTEDNYDDKDDENISWDGALSKENLSCSAKSSLFQESEDFVWNPIIPPKSEINHKTFEDNGLLVSLQNSKIHLSNFVEDHESYQCRTSKYSYDSNEYSITIDSQGEILNDNSFLKTQCLLQLLQVNSLQDSD